MIIEFNKKKNFYDDLVNKLYECEFDKNICYNFVPVKICNEYYILTSSKNLDGYLIDYKDNIDIKLYITDNENNQNKSFIEYEIQLNNIVVFGTDSTRNQTNCYIDTINNLLLIKFNSSKLNYIEIDNNLNCENDLRFDSEKIKFKYVWTDENLNLRSIHRFSKIINIWKDKYINLPSIPYMIDFKEPENFESKSFTQLYPITGSTVYDSNDNFLGIVSYVNDTEIIIIPLICIKKISDYLVGEKMLYLALDTLPTKLDFKSGLNNIDFQDGLLVMNCYYDNIIKKKNKLQKKIKKLQNNNNELQNDNNELQNNNNKNLNNELSNELSNVFVNKNNQEKKTTNQLKLKNIIEMNCLLEQNNFIELIESDKNLKKGNIICSVDNYKVNSEGSLIISIDELNNNKYKTIPLKSYIWLFKNSTNNKLLLNNISPNNFNCDLTKLFLNNDEFYVKASHIKKQIILNESSIELKSEYDLISSFGYTNLKYISYRNLKLMEINERILDIMNEFLSYNDSLYSLLLEKIFNNKYTIGHKKQLLIIYFEKKTPIIKLVSNEIKNFEDLLNKYKTKKELKKFLLKQS
jgi:hypothetical protein